MPWLRKSFGVSTIRLGDVHRHGTVRLSLLSLLLGCIPLDRHPREDKHIFFVRNYCPKEVVVHFGSPGHPERPTLMTAQCYPLHNHGYQELWVDDSVSLHSIYFTPRDKAGAPVNFSRKNGEAINYITLCPEFSDGGVDEKTW